MDLKKLEQLYKNELLKNIVPFWLEKSQDKKLGGYFTCLDREGNVFDTDKYIWLQAREVWMWISYRKLRSFLGLSSNSSP